MGTYVNTLLAPSKNISATNSSSQEPISIGVFAYWYKPLFPSFDDDRCPAYKREQAKLSRGLAAKERAWKGHSISTMVRQSDLENLLLSKVNSIQVYQYQNSLCWPDYAQNEVVIGALYKTINGEFQYETLN